jgi:hypothetical protein
MWTPKDTLHEMATASRAGDCTELHDAVICNQPTKVWALCTAGACPVVTCKAGLRPADYATSPLIQMVLRNATQQQRFLWVTHL